MSNMNFSIFLRYGLYDKKDITTVTDSFCCISLGHFLLPNPPQKEVLAHLHIWQAADAQMWPRHPAARPANLKISRARLASKYCGGEGEKSHPRLHSM